jgi:hypothetical protein
VKSTYLEQMSPQFFHEVSSALNVVKSTLRTLFSAFSSVPGYPGVSEEMPSFFFGSNTGKGLLVKRRLGCHRNGGQPYGCRPSPSNFHPSSARVTTLPSNFTLTSSFPTHLIAIWGAHHDTEKKRNRCSWSSQQSEQEALTSQ